MSNKISKQIGVLNKLKHFFPIFTLKTLYDSLIVPHYNYEILTWGYDMNQNLNCIKSMSELLQIQNLMHILNRCLKNIIH